MTALTMTRRTALGTGLTLVSLAGSVGAAAATRHLELGSADALLVDDAIALPDPVAAFVQARGRTMPVIGVQLDAGGYAGLMRVLDRSRALTGISSGAVLFCVERIAAEHGFRLTGHRQSCSSRLCKDARREDVLAFLGGTTPLDTDAVPRSRAYRPSHADQMLHAWIMHKAVGSRPRQGVREA
jgi:hypothetical protein